MYAEPTDLRWVPVRLTDIDRDRRWKAALEVCEREPDRFARLEVLAAAAEPSSTVYFIAA